jgi:hypothetical protein
MEMSERRLMGGVCRSAGLFSEWEPLVMCGMEMSERGLREVHADLRACFLEGSH